MNELGFITDAQQEEALAQPLVIKREVNSDADARRYVTEMARQIAAERFPTTSTRAACASIRRFVKEDQEAAYNSVRRGVLDYDRRHGYRGAEAYVDISEIKSEQDEALDELLLEFQDAEDCIRRSSCKPTASGFAPTAVAARSSLSAATGLKFAADDRRQGAGRNKRLRRGAIIRVQTDDKDNWRIVQLPEVEAAFLAADPRDGAIRALVGGFDFNRNKFNHVTQAWRQPGSSFKPFIYSGALEKGFTPGLGDQRRTDQLPGFGHRQPGLGTEELRRQVRRARCACARALAKSKNMVSIRLLQASGVRFVQDYVTRFGFDASKHPPYLTMALGAGSVTPWEMVTAYAVFANGGYRIRPYVVARSRTTRIRCWRRPSRSPPATKPCAPSTRATPT
ncbi:MAG: penicillin-binding transpeptidase domain-containing protein [Candidatus Accumulibacter propinquus]